MKIHLWTLTVVLVCGALSGPACLAEDDPQAGVEPPVPPTITYGSSRESNTWIETPGGTRVAVGKGVEWKGVKVYLSLLWDLVGVDTTTGKTLYAVNVGAYWNSLTFNEVTPKGGTKVWAVELASRHPTRRSADRRQYHDLRTGKKLEIPGLIPTPSGIPFKPRANWYGDKCDIAKAFTVVVSTHANWMTLQERVFGVVIPKRFGAIDFRKEVVLVTSSGNSWNCRGIDFGAGYEDDARLLLRTRRHSFQTIGGGQKTRPWGIFVLPRRVAKAYEVERNAQGLIGGPAIWKRIFRLEKLGQPEAELAALPPRSDKQHYGWEGQDERPPLPPPKPPRRNR